MRSSFTSISSYRRINYAVDHESVGRRAEPIVMIDHLVDKINDPNWNREQQLCDHCEGWTPKDGDKARPKRPGTPDPLLGCSGCWYAAVDKLDTPVIVTQPSRRRREPSYLGGDAIRWNGRRLVVEAVGWARSTPEPIASREESQPFREPGSYTRAYLLRPLGRPSDAPANEDGDWVWMPWLSKWLWVPQKLRRDL